MKKTQKNILIAFILNLTFSVMEYVGGILTGSVAIISDSVHDLGDALSIGLSYFLEKKSQKGADENYTYGYVRYSVLGGLITLILLISGSLIVIYASIKRIIHPTEINYNGMIIFAVFGVIVNFVAAWVTREGDSINQKAVNLHMLEDVLGWVVVLAGAILMRFTDISIIDPIMSIGVAAFILISSIKGLKEIVDIFLLKTPEGVSVSEIKEHILEIDGVSDVHHIHLWSIDGNGKLITMHIVAENATEELKHTIKEELKEHGIMHSTLEFEAPGEICEDMECCADSLIGEAEHGHHHHHH